jgi:hypothetical protein
VGKIDFKKVEENLLKALQSRFIQKLVKGEATVSEQAVSFYGMDSGPRQKPQDAVIQELEQIEQEEKAFEEQEKRRLEIEQAKKEGRPIPPEKPKEEVKKEDVLPKPPPQQDVREPIETVHDISFTPLFLLRKHILWFKKKHVKDIYKILGVSPEEIQALRKKQKISDVEDKKIKELLLKAKEMKAKVMKKLGLEQDSSLVEKERKRHIHKRLNVKDTWLQL